MGVARIKIVSIGHLPNRLNIKSILNWKSSIFEIVGTIENHALRRNSDMADWTFSDSHLKQAIPDKFDGAFIIAMVNVPIEDKWFTRPIGDNKILITFHEIRKILDDENIPLENIIIRILYAYTLIYRRANNKIPDLITSAGFTHDETRGCIFDMNGLKFDLVESCDKPNICDECQEKLRAEKISNDLIENTQAEIKKIRKSLYHRILDFVKRHPVYSLCISSMSAIILGVISSLIASYIYDGLKN